MSTPAIETGPLAAKTADWLPEKLRGQQCETASSYDHSVATPQLAFQQSGCSHRRCAFPPAQLSLVNCDSFAYWPTCRSRLTVLFSPTCSLLRRHGLLKALGRRANSVAAHGQTGCQKESLSSVVTVRDTPVCLLNNYFSLGNSRALGSRTVPLMAPIVLT
jgi:hypothetical protein